MRYDYYICDVFTDVRFGGNQLAVLPRATGLSAGQMQRIAREFNFSESAFVLPAEQGHTRRVRIFTPTMEVPFAGHPNIGTAFVLAATGGFGEIGDGTTVTFEERAGLVPIAIGTREQGRLWCEMSAPEMLSVGKSVTAALVARAVSLEDEAVIATRHAPQVTSVGLPFLIAELRDRDALARARVNIAGLDALAAEGVTPDVFLYVRSGDEFDLRARMFAPFDGVPEDPATGSANCALAGLLARLDERATATFRWRVAQGVEMGRPSVLEARADKREGVIVATGVGGACVMFASGAIEIEPDEEA